MNGVCHQLLPGAGLSINQNPAVGRRHQLDLLAQGFHGNALAHDHAARGKLLLEFPVFLAHVFRVDGVLHQDEGLVDREWFFQEIVGPELGSPHRGFDGAVARDHDDLGSIFHIPDFLEGFEAIHSGEPDIEQHYVKRAFAQSFEAGFATARNPDLIVFVLQHALQRLLNAGLVVHDENVMHAGEWRGRELLQRPPATPPRNGFPPAGSPRLEWNHDDPR